MSFGDRLKEARKAKKMTQEQLANEIGVAKSTLAGYEKGNREPDLYKIRLLIDILDVDSDYLLGIDREKKENATAEEIDNDVNVLFNALKEKHGQMSPEKLKLILKLAEAALESDV